MQAGKGSVTGRAREPKENLDGFLARLHRFPRNEGRATNLGRAELESGSFEPSGVVRVLVRSHESAVTACQVLA